MENDFSECETLVIVHLKCNYEHFGPPKRLESPENCYS